MKIKTSELSGVALNYAVAIACAYKCALHNPSIGPDEWIVMGREEMWLERDPAYFDVWSPSTDWSQGGPLIERFLVTVTGSDCEADEDDDWRWGAAINDHPNSPAEKWEQGPTALIAACRIIVASKLGDEVDVPEGLV